MNKSELRQIIKEEISRLNEARKSSYYGKDIKNLNLNLDPLQWMFDVNNHKRMVARNGSMFDAAEHTCYISEDNYDEISFLAYFFYDHDGRVHVKVTEEKNGDIVFFKKYYYDKDALRDFKKIVGQNSIKFFKGGKIALFKECKNEQTKINERKINVI
jgi:hypothetical protein